MKNRPILSRASDATSAMGHATFPGSRGNWLSFCSSVASFVAATTLGCSSDNDGASGESTGVTEVEIMCVSTDLTIPPMLDAVIGIFEDEHPEYRVKFTAYKDGEEMRPKLAERMKAGNPPDLFWEGGQTMPQWLSVGRGVMALDEMYEEMKWNDHILEGAIKDSTINGKIYSVPINFQRHNNIFYSIKAFHDNGISVPKNIDEFFTACEKLKTAGIGCTGTVAENWILRMLFNPIAISVGGGKFFADHFAGQGSLDQDKLNASVDAFVRLVKDYTVFGNSENGYRGAADLLINEKAATFMHGPWTVAYFDDNALTPGTDYGVFGSPGAENTTLYQTSVYAIPKDAKNPKGAKALLDAFVSAKGQLEYNTLNRSCPVRLGVTMDTFDDVGKAMCQTEGITITIPVWEQWDPAFKAFVEALSFDENGKVQVPDQAVTDLKTALSVPLSPDK